MLLCVKVGALRKSLEAPAHSNNPFEVGFSMPCHPNITHHCVSRVTAGGGITVTVSDGSEVTVYSLCAERVVLDTGYIA